MPFQQDLNLLPDFPISMIAPNSKEVPFSFISPKIEPKLEQIDNEPIPAIPPIPTTPLPNNSENPNPTNPQNPIPNPIRDPYPNVDANPFQNPTAPQQLSPEESDVYAEFIRISQLFRAAFAEKLQQRFGDVSALQPGSMAIIPSGQDDPVSSAIVAATPRPKRARSGEMVRASPLGLHDQQFFRNSVRKTRMVYESLRLFLIRQDDIRFLQLGINAGKRCRADMKSAAAMLERDLWLNRDKRIIGSIPGIDIGDQFFFRIELCVVGLHGQVQAGIDYVSAGLSPSREPIATSIIVSGGYEDDEDGGDIIIYTGHGGKERHFLRHSVHQKLQGGNLALERSRHYGIEIRVIRGLKCDGSPTGKVYVYDGLYRIIDCWLDLGKSGFGVYKYKLVRIAGQPEMGSVIMRYAANLRADPLSVRPSGYSSLDISKGKENLPVYLFNDVDVDNDPMLYEYIVGPVYPPSTFEGSVGGGCDCVSGCSNGCQCILKNGGELVYDSSGILLRGKPLIYECGRACRCPPNCHNRVTQKGVTHRLEVFRSRETGWGVRSLDAIRAGAFICEYSGVVLTEEQAEVISMNGDSLIHPSRFTNRWVEWGDISCIYPEYIRPAFPLLPQLKFAMDVSRMRNVACYFSHSCSPNVLVQFVLHDHYNVSYPHVMLFALENIPPLRELSIDYGVVEGYTGKIAPEMLPKKAENSGSNVTLF